MASVQKWSRIALRYAQAALTIHIFQKYIGGVGSTVGISMIPTIPPEYFGYPYILYSSLHRRGRGVKVGDVITYTHPLFPKQSGCKRIIGMPGDFVSAITPCRLDDDVEAEDVDGKWARVTEQVIQVPEGHCWVAGDNLEWSRDSRLYGPLPLGLVRSKVLAVVKPFKDAKWLGAEHNVKDAQEKEHDWVIS
ncbi:mitochondrial inner membrane protease subunit [Parastagonospora nodorum SN15]|uniref:Mitochondrial inner membrane protease subunit n=1 Tax=Phaeosphaeria nodorum (strain SN15 / ATCC MYA-4574 / FGSC 10173) TaxID=321614 RepID=A0A7U2FG36_PHANO|nr:mitochondrial inner membrane protease subunit [Parastagonospora nodorum SN15]